MICPVCKGSCNIVTFNPLRFWDCPCCGGAGVTELGIGGNIKLGGGQHAFMRPISKARHKQTEFKLEDFLPNATLAHVMAKAGIFPSIGQAKKNGWDRPIEKGSWVVAKKFHISIK